MQKTQEFGIGDLLPIALTIGVTAIGIAFTANILGDIRDDMTAGTTEYNSTVDGIDAMGAISGKLGIIVTVVIAAVLIGILLSYLMVKFR